LCYSHTLGISLSILILVPMRLLSILLVFVAIAMRLPADVAMVLGFCLGLTPKIGELLRECSAKFSKQLLAIAIVIVGFTIQFGTLAATGWATLWITVISIFSVVLAGLWLGQRVLKQQRLGLLIGSGTAICGASAISAVGAGIGAGGAEMAMALAVVLVFNCLALFTFPWLGHLLQLSPQQFGVWAGLAIHDTSSVVGAASIYSMDSLNIAATVKLARAVWIVPLAAFAARKFGSRDSTTKVPWFIWGFILASVAGTVFGLPVPTMEFFSSTARCLLGAAIFLIGSTITVRQLREVGGMAVLVGAILWAISLSLSLCYVVISVS
jgi:uncharacterized integral membrane protein (TIGR00698 family)